jgi:hypothetical protein
MAANTGSSAALLITAVLRPDGAKRGTGSAFAIGTMAAAGMLTNSKRRDSVLSSRIRPLPSLGLLPR